MNRRQFLLRSMAVLGGTLAGVVGYSRYLEPEWLRLERVRIGVPSLPPSLEGYTIGVLADLHLGRLVPTERVRKAAARLAALKPDLILVAGDMTGVVDDDHAEAQRLIDEGLEPVKGAYGVLGNWDYFGHRLPPGVKHQTAVRLLVNEGVEPVPGLWLAGVDDVLWGQPDLDSALAGAPASAVRILLAHEPDFADRVRPEHRIALQISGHTHGGQVRAPLLGPLLLPPLGEKYVAGLYQAPACPVYVSRGVGMTQIPVRFLCPPEITLITLTRELG